MQTKKLSGNSIHMLVIPNFFIYNLPPLRKAPPSRKFKFSNWHNRSTRINTKLSLSMFPKLLWRTHKDNLDVIYSTPVCDILLWMFFLQFDLVYVKKSVIYIASTILIILKRLIVVPSLQQILVASSRMGFPQISPHHHIYHMKGNTM
jgi:hypothetical protein